VQLAFLLIFKPTLNPDPYNHCTLISK